MTPRPSRCATAWPRCTPGTASMSCRPWPTCCARCRRLAAGDVTPQQVCALTDPIRQHLQRLAEQAAEGMARIVPTLQPAQLEHLARAVREAQPEVARRMAGRHARRAAGTPPGAHRGPLRELLRPPERGPADPAAPAHRHSSFDPRLAWAERLRRQQDMLRVLQEHRGGDRPAHVQAEMLALLQRSLESPEPEYRKQFERTLAGRLRRPWPPCTTAPARHNGAS